MNPLKNKKNFALLGTGLLVIFLFSYYVFTYIPAREQQMNQRGIRAINRLDENLQERIEHYKKSVSQFECDYYIINREAIEEIIGNRIYFRLFSCASEAGNSNKESGEQDLLESLKSDFKVRMDLFRKKYPFKEYAIESYKKERSEEFTKMLFSFANDRKVDLKAFQNSLKPNATVDELIEAFNSIDKSKAIFIDSITSGYSGKAYAYLGITYENALKRIDNGTLFKDVILSEPDSSRVVNANRLNLNYFRYTPSNENETNLLETITPGSEAAKKDKGSDEDHSTIHIENVDITKKTISEIDYICFTRYVEIQGKPLYLTGLIEMEAYHASVRQVSIWVVMIFILLSLFFVLVLPIAKPFLLSKKERLRANDLMWSAVALVFGIAILSLLIIGVDTFAIEEKDLVNKKLAGHTDSLISQFQSELDSSIKASKMSSIFSLNKDNLKKASAVYENSERYVGQFKEGELLRKSAIDKTGDSNEKQKSVNASLKEIVEKESIFIKALGMELIKISHSGSSELFTINAKTRKYSIVDLKNKFNKLRKSVYDPKDLSLLSKYLAYKETLDSIDLVAHQINEDLNLSHRNYYQVMKEEKPKNAWSFKGKDGSITPYYVESVFSLSSGKYTSITVTKGDPGLGADIKQYSYATDYEWESVNNRYLEPGYTFAIIDNQGSIQYHSDQRKIKNQNFLEETDFDNKVSSFLHNKSKQGLGLKFSMKDHQAFVSPIKNTPWFAVVMFDIRKSRLNVTQSIITSFQIVIMILLYMILLHVVLQIDKSSSSHGQKNIFSYLFLSPVNVSTRVLTVLARFNLIQILLLLIVYSANSINLMANVSIFFSMITVGILLNYVMLTKFNLVMFNQKNVGTSKSVSGFEWVLLMLWLFWFVLIGISSNGAWYATFIQVVHLLFIIVYFYMKGESPLKDYFLSVNIKQSFFEKGSGGYLPFYIHSFSWIVLMGVVSTFLFFKPIYNMQHLKRGLNNWVEEFEVKNSDLFETQPNHKFNLFHSEDTNSAHFNNKFVRESNEFIDKISMYFDEDEASFIGQGKSLDSIVIQEKTDVESGTPYFYIHPIRDTYRQKVNKPEGNAIIAFDLPSIDHSEEQAVAVIFWLSIILFIWLVFFIVQALAKKFFYLNLLKRLKAVSAEIDDKRASLGKLSVGGFSIQNANLMLVGPPYSGRNAIAKGVISEAKECKYLDFFNKLDKEEEKIDTEFVKNPIIINNFDYRNLDYKLNDTKLDLLEKIIRMRNEHQISAPLILISTFSTNQILAFYRNRVKELMEEKADHIEEIKGLTSSVYRWESILFGFTTYLVKLSHKPSSDFIDNELNFGSTLIYLKPQIREFEEKLLLQKEGLTDEEVEEKLVEAITDMAQNYYFAIWNGCSQEEKFLLFDMAQDGLVNPKNERTLSILVRKGLILTSPIVRIFNRSFAKFVVENISEEDGAQLERQAKKDGIWRTYKYLALFLVIIMIVFLAFVEQEVINKMTGIITAGGILLPRIVSFASSLGNMKLFGKKAA